MNSMMSQISEYSPNVQIYSINDENFRRYGKKITGFDFTEFIEYLNTKTQIPQYGNKYVASDQYAEKLALLQELEDWFYGGMPLEIGWCNGHNKELNALEYHKSSEIDVAATSSILLLGSILDIKEGKIDVTDIEAFYIEQGQAVELYGTTLHYSPCEVSDSGFRMGIILPRGTNEAIDLKERIDPTLWMRNKWLLAHPDADNLIGRGAYAGITGEMIKILHA